MRAAIYESEGKPLVVEPVDLLEPGPLDVVVRMEASGVCHSDVSIMEGKLGIAPPLILGHEGTGIVEVVGAAVASLNIGDRVIGTVIPACGHCWYCLRSESYLCESQRIRPRSRLARPDGQRIPALSGLGTFADVMTAAEASLVRVETDLPAEQLALVGCGFTTGFGAALNTAAVEAGSTVAVVGCGGVGQAVIQGARVCGAADIIAVDPVPAKRAVATRLGATHAVDPDVADPVAQVRELTAGRGVDYAFEAIGLPATIVQTIEMARRGGTAVMVGATRIDDEVTLSAFDLMNAGKRLLGSVLGSSQVRRDFARILALTEAGRLDLGSMVSRQFALEDVNEAMQAMVAGDVIRAVVRF